MFSNIRKVMVLVAVFALPLLGACSRTADGGYMLSPNGAGLVMRVSSDIPHTKHCLTAPSFSDKVACEKGQTYQKGRMLESVQEMHREQEEQAFAQGAEHGWRNADGIGFNYVQLMNECNNKSKYRTAVEARRCRQGVSAGNSAVALDNEESARRNNEYWFRQGQGIVGPVPGYR